MLLDEEEDEDEDEVDFEEKMLLRFGDTTLAR